MTDRTSRTVAVALSGLRPWRVVSIGGVLPKCRGRGVAPWALALVVGLLFFGVGSTRPALAAATPAPATGGSEGHGDAPPELPNFIHLLYEHYHSKALAEGTDPNAGAAGFFKVLHKGPLKEPLPLVGKLPWENNVFSIIAALVVFAVFRVGTRRMSVESPSRWQSFVESVVEWFLKFVCEILGPHHGRIFAPYIMTLFLFILTCNILVLFPLMKPPTVSLVMTGSLAILTFLLVQGAGIATMGPWGYMRHLMGDPHNIAEWILAPLFFVLHVIGELARPLSLALRLFGNILGEDILLAVFLILGVMLVGAFGVHPPKPGIPLHFPFLFVVLLNGTIQALVFSLLTTIYLLMALPHDEHDEEKGTVGSGSADGGARPSPLRAS